MCSALPWVGARGRSVAEAKLDITDELLVAYVDDELDPSQREMVRSVLAGNPALSRRADEMRLARELLNEAFPLRPDADVPAPIDAAANRLADACAQRSSRPKVTSFSRRELRYAAIAASLLLCVAVAATYLVRRDDVDSADRAGALMRIDPETSLFQLLEHTPSTEVINIPADNAALRAILTFRAKDGRFCREFEILAGTRGTTGVACRQQGRWHAEVLMSAAAATPNSNYYTPAGESDDAAVSDIVDRLIQGDPLGAEEETRVLASGWEASKRP
jgi:hypothetical protein